MNIKKPKYLFSLKARYKEIELPFTNVTTTICAEYGRYVIYYNERTSGVSYPKDYEVTNVFTELCEVSVEGNQF